MAIVVCIVKEQIPIKTCIAHEIKFRWCYDNFQMKLPKSSVYIMY